LKWNRRTDGSETLFLKDEEIERIMEDELEKAGLFPAVEEPVVDLEAFIEKHLGAKLDQHADLEANLLGETELRRGERALVKINRDLTGLADDFGRLGDVGRLRSTLAHEGSHVVLHRVEFELGQDQGYLFGATRPAGENGVRMFRCLKRDLSAGGDPREWQANKGMAALLMPRRLFRGVALPMFEASGVRPLQLDRTDRKAYELACRIAEIFRTSRQAALIRLETLRLVARADEVGLDLA